MTYMEAMMGPDSKK
jgi:hypothetical protein